jgi:hypothetical protein
MELAQLSPNSVAANPSYINPLAQSDRQASTAKASESVQNSIKQIQTDTVTLSSQALKMASQSYSPAEEAKESAPEKTYEKVQGKQ